MKKIKLLALSPVAILMPVMLSSGCGKVTQEFLNKEAETLYKTRETINNKAVEISKKYSKEVQDEFPKIIKTLSDDIINKFFTKKIKNQTNPKVLSLKNDFVSKILDDKFLDEYAKEYSELLSKKPNANEIKNKDEFKKAMTEFENKKNELIKKQTLEIYEDDLEILSDKVKELLKTDKSQESQTISEELKDFENDLEHNVQKIDEKLSIFFNSINPNKDQITFVNILVQYCNLISK